MQIAETVTFGGSGLDRAGHLRGQPEKIATMRAQDGARAVVLWRGKPLVAGDDRARLALVPLDHAVLKHAFEAPVFLGLDSGAARFAYDVSSWEPHEDAETLGAFMDPSEQRHPMLPDENVFVELRRVMTWLTPRDAELAATAKAIFSWHETHGFCARCGFETVVNDAGWQRNCPACRAAHFPRTDPVVIMLITRGNSVLMGRSPGWPRGMYSLLAGFVEPGESLEAAVRREVFEESGIEVGEVNFLASQPWPFPASLMFGCAGVATSEKITIDPKEIEDALWVTKEEMMDIFAGRHPNILPAREGAIAHFLLENWLADTLT